MRKWVIALLALALAASGCTVQIQGEQPAPAATSTADPAAAEIPAPSEPAQASEQRPAIRLVPMDPAWELGWRMPVPEGWQVNVSALQDNVQISNGDVLIMVSTRQLRGQAAPKTVAEMRQFIASWAVPGTQINQVQHRGVASAFELRYPVQGDGPPQTDLSLYLFGSTHRQIVTLTAPTAEMAQWEPLFREMLAAFVPADLGAVPLPGRP